MQPLRSTPDHPTRMDNDLVQAALRAARHGERAYPGPVGELIRRELYDYVEAGEELDSSALAPRLIAVLAAGPDRDVARPAGPWAHLPARYRPGSPMHWDYGTGQRAASPAGTAPSSRDAAR